MRFSASKGFWVVISVAAVLVALDFAYAQQEQRGELHAGGH